MFLPVRDSRKRGSDFDEAYGGSRPNHGVEEFSRGGRSDEGYGGSEAIGMEKCPSVHSKEEDDEDEQKEKILSMAKTSLSLCVTMVCGLLYGICVEKAHILEPWSIRSSFMFRHSILWKFLLSALVTSTLSFLLISTIAPEMFMIARGNFAIEGLLTLRKRGLIVGGLLMGIGMCLSSTLPSLIPMQATLGIQNSFWALIGYAWGAMIFGAVHNNLRHFLYHDKEPKITNQFLDMHQKYSFSFYALPLLTLFTVSSIYLEINVNADEEINDLFPTQGDEGERSSVWAWGSFAWHPIYCGALVGLMQLFTVSILAEGIGSSTGVMFLTAQLLRLIPNSSFYSYWYRYVDVDIPNTWQFLVYWVFAPIGALLSVAYSGASEHIKLTAGVTPMGSFIGAFLLIFGSRMCGQSPSGHTLSGVPFLFVGSWVVIPMMLLGGFLMALGLSIFNQFQMSGEHHPPRLIGLTPIKD